MSLASPNQPTTEEKDESEEAAKSLTRVHEASEGAFLQFLRGIAFTDDERQGILDLFRKAKTIVDRQAARDGALSPDEVDFTRTTAQEVVLAYFASWIDTNPSAGECLERLQRYHQQNPLELGDPHPPAVLPDGEERHKLAPILAAGVFELGTDSEGRPLACIDTNTFDTKWDHVLVARHFRRSIFTVLWNATTDEYNLEALRKGVMMHVDLSGWGMRFVNRRLIGLLKGVGTKLPFQLRKVYLANPPFLLNVFLKVAGTMLPAHTMGKLQVLKKKSGLFKEGLAQPQAVPKNAGGDLVFAGEPYFTARGYL